MTSKLVTKAPLRVLHIGLHKTGSTFLQQEVFPKLSGVNYYGRGTIADSWKKGMRPVLGNSVVWSTEAALGWPYPTAEPPRISELMVLCHDLGISHLLVVKREFPAWVRSVWFQTLNEWGTESFDHWYLRNRESLEKWRNVFHDLRIATEIKGICMKVICFEKLRSDPEQELLKIAKFLGSDYPQGVNLNRRSNASMYGTTFLSTYRLLNLVVRGKVLRKLTQLMRITPRAHMQHGPLGKLFQRLSGKKLGYPNDLAALDWIDFK